MEPPSGPNLRQLLRSRGPLDEHTLLFAHWRQQIGAATLHLSSHSTFLLRAPVGLEHVHAADGGFRLVLHSLPWGAEFPEAAFKVRASGVACATLMWRVCRM